MDAEHKRPLAAFVVVALASMLLLAESLSSQPSPEDPPGTSQVSGRPTVWSSASSSPASGQVVEGVTPTSQAPTMKSIGRTPLLTARGDDGLGVSLGAVRDPAGKQTDPVRTRDNGATPGPQGQQGSPEPKPTGGPPTGGPLTGGPPTGADDGSPGNSDGHAQGPRGDHGPLHDGVPPTPPSHGPQ